LIKITSLKSSGLRGPVRPQPLSRTPPIGAAFDAKDPDELLRILQELNRVLKDEEQVRHDFKDATPTIVTYEDTLEYRPT
jgi:hypothetical protein